MKNLEQIKNEYARELGFYSWITLTNLLFDYENEVEIHTDRVTKRYATEYAKETLKNASKGFTPAKIVYNEKTRSYDKVASIKDILSESNLPKHR